VTSKKRQSGSNTLDLLFLINKIFGNYNLIETNLSMPHKSLSQL